MIVLDTCALLWLAEGGGQLSAPLLARLDEEPIVAVSAISAFEISLKVISSKLVLPLPVREWWKGVVDHHRLSVIDITGEIALKSTELAPIHRDPADRFIISTALLNNAPIVTADRRFEEYSVTVLL